MSVSSRKITLKGNKYVKRVQSYEKANIPTVQEKVVYGNSNLCNSINYKALILILHIQILNIF